MFGGTAFAGYGAFWMGYGLLGTLAESGVYNAPNTYPKGSQMALCLWGKALHHSVHNYKYLVSETGS